MTTDRLLVSVILISTLAACSGDDTPSDNSDAASDIGGTSDIGDAAGGDGASDSVGSDALVDGGVDGGIDGGEGDSGADAVATLQSFVGTIEMDSDVTLAVELALLDEAPLQSTKDVADERRLAGRLALSPSLVVTVEGSIDTETGSVSFAAEMNGAPAITCSGTLSDGFLSGTCALADGGGSGSFALADVDLTDVNSYCGELGGPVTGQVAVITAGGAAVGAFAAVGSVGALSGTFDGTTVALTTSGGSATGTLTDQTITGTWTLSSISGTFTATAGSCPTLDGEVEPGDSWHPDATIPCDGALDTADHTNVFLGEGTFACAAVGDARTLKCWGFTLVSWTWLDGLEPAFNIRNEPVVLLNDGSPITGVTSVSMAGYNFCYTLDDGSAWCIGNGHYGELGVGEPAPDFSTVPVRVAGVQGSSDEYLEGAVEIFTNAAPLGGTSCALLDDGRVVCWGYNASNMLGTGGESLTQAYAPIEIEGLGDVVDLEVSGSTACAVLNDSTVKCWGDNYYGQHGVPTRAAQGFGGFATPETVMLTPTQPLTGAVRVEFAPWQSVCALREDTSVVCWGWETPSALGYPTQSDRPANGWIGIPLATPALDETMCGVDAMSMSGTQGCVLNRANEVYCFGTTNALGTLGTGFDLSGPEPSKVETGDVVEVRAFGGATCVARATVGVSQFACWGDDQNALVPGNGNFGVYEPLPFPLPLGE